MCGSLRIKLRANLKKKVRDARAILQSRGAKTNSELQRGARGLVVDQVAQILTDGDNNGLTRHHCVCIVGALGGMRCDLASDDGKKHPFFGPLLGKFYVQF